jgi:hypothetical protein
MGSQQPDDSKSSPNESQKGGRQAQQRSDAHTNSARAGESPDRVDDGADAGQQKRGADGGIERTVTQ